MNIEYLPLLFGESLTIDTTDNDRAVLLYVKKIFTNHRKDFEIQLNCVDSSNSEWAKHFKKIIEEKRIAILYVNSTGKEEKKLLFHKSMVDTIQDVVSRCFCKQVRPYIQVNSRIIYLNPFESLSCYDSEKATLVSDRCEKYGNEREGFVHLI